MAPKNLATGAAVLLVLWLGAAAAHHSVAGVFDNTKRASLTGTITKIDWINPHTYLYLDVKDDAGNVMTWRLQSLPTAMLRKAGLSSEMLMAGGATVTADALLARDGSAHLAWVLKLTYEDGHFYQLAGE
jgi:Family of unknown function (DUF6152)